jgi:UDPglucose 6-dehydrogenase
MNVAVLGLWHLGPVTAACMAAAGHRVMAFDPDPAIVAALAASRPPVAEPGLAALITQGIQSGTLSFTTDRAHAVRQADVVWVTFDTPVDQYDTANVDHVTRQIEAAFPDLTDGSIVLCSSQLPVGTVRTLEESWSRAAAARVVSFACSPENLRLGKAIDIFMHPDRVVVGLRDDRARDRLATLLAPVTDRVEWMSVESAEMTKHAVNAFLATSVTFINELATLCEGSGADAKEVERGLRTERRIGPHAYLSPGGAFAGGTLGRDVAFLRTLGASLRCSTPLMDGVLASNTTHSRWACRRLESAIADLAGAKIAVWGLTYKPSTDTLRRSPAIEVCQWLVDKDADVHVHDPEAEELPLSLSVTRHQDPVDAAAGARALLVETNWPCYLEVDRDRLAAVAPDLLILDANRFLELTLGADRRFRVATVGQPA